MKNLIGAGTANAAATDDDDGTEFSLGDLYAQVMARKWIVVLTTVLGVSIGAFLGQLPPDQYRAGSLVHIERRATGIELPEVLVGQGFRTSNVGRISTEAHIIRSRFILGPVVNQLNLDWRLEPKRFPVVGDMVVRRSWPAVPNWVMPAYTRNGDAITLDLLEVDAPLVGRRAQIVVTGEGTFDVTLGRGDAQTTVSGSVGEIVQIVPGFRFRLSEMTAGAGREYTLWRSSSEAAIARLRGGLGIRERGTNSGIVDFTYASTDRILARNAANAVVASYQTQNLNRQSAEIDQSIAFLEEQLPQVRRQTAEAADALSAFRQQTESTELTISSQDLLSRIVGIEAQLEELRFEEEQLARTLTENHPDYRELLERRDRLDRVRLID